MENSEVREKLIKILNSNEVNDELIEEELKKKLITTDELKEKIQEAVEKPTMSNSALDKRMNRVFGKVKIKAKQIVDIQESGLNNLLDDNIDLKKRII